MKENNKPLLYDEKDGVAFIRMNRPDMKNAINSECWHLFEDYFNTLSSRSDVRVFAKENFMQQVQAYVESLMANGPQALKCVKQIVAAAMDMPETEALSLETEQAADNILSRQCIEGISAFLEKRTPEWRA